MLTEASGTTPAGLQDPEQASAWVRRMFGGIAPRYDLLNHLLSLNIDRYWRARTVRAVADILKKPGACVLDVACGTGDLMLALETRGPARILGSDFCHPMLIAAGAKAGARRSRARLFEADALQLPIASASLDLATIAFGFRNLANYESGLRELFRVLKPGGVLAILEFSTPPNALLARGYDFYSRAILPTIGGWISGSREAYSYLPESVRKFPNAEQLGERMRAAGFAGVRFHRMTAGIVALHLGERV
ncbi:MAG TPA: bifunctional demethylmenaquinone methyltransferase/2-methoxy-6-polyprenyl-1,4-benzoquinol methylase UbiE [Bryobacteraceae bacterium]|nr:bifunctional demethylmenaquinone methyltransferase/2-methoxy-6-polyprenyl-1,4-benzoquinol methylase UbiE [Bryobacteraceae bacterium]